MKNAKLSATIAVALTGAAAAALANESITYTYDARGRLIKVEHSGTINNGLVANYTLDKVENRERVKVTGAP